MSKRYAMMTGGIAVIVAGLAMAGSAAAQNASQDAMKQCGDKWQAAKAANKTGNDTWPQFLSKCRADLAKKPAAPPAATAKPAAAATTAKPAAPAKPATAATPATPAKPATTAAPAKPAAAPAKPVAAPAKPAAAPAAPATPAKPATAATPAKPAAPAAAAKAAAGGMVFPARVDPKYASEKPGDARRKTCLDQYNANKAANNGAGNGGKNWIEKGGGYYSECNKRLSGA